MHYDVDESEVFKETSIIVSYLTNDLSHYHMRIEIKHAQVQRVYADRSSHDN